MIILKIEMLSKVSRCIFWETVTRSCSKLMFPIVSGILRLDVDVVVKGLLHSFISQLFWQTNKHLQENIQQTPAT